MGRNTFPINAAAINALNQNGVVFAFPSAPIDEYNLRALKHEALIARDGQSASLKTMEPTRTFSCVMAEKKLRSVDGATPLSYQRKIGYVSTVALSRVGFLGKIRRGDTVSTADVVWHVEEAFIQKVAGVPVRWVLTVSESGTI